MESSGAASSSAGYEFTTAENAIIGRSGTWLGYMAWILLAFGVLSALMGIFTLPFGVANLAIGGLYVVLGMYFRDSARSLNAVVTTAGNDIAHLMTALEKMGSAFKLTVILTVVGMVLGFVAAIAVGAFAAASGGGF